MSNHQLKKLCISLALISQVLGIQPALAEWEYTRWGMSPEEVKAASSGQAIPISGREQGLTEKEGERTLLKSRWTLNEYDFDVYFNFSGSEPTLVEVLLVSRGNNQNIISAFNQRYGPPRVGVGNLRLQRRPDFSLIPTNPNERTAPTPEGNLSSEVEWDTPNTLIRFNRLNAQEVNIRYLPQKSKLNN